MASHSTSNPHSPGAFANAIPVPPQQRGRERVAAIMAAAVEVFAEKGYEAATMTEIAARADTAIGSMYRFFASKEALALALLHQYQLHIDAELDAIAAAALAPAAIAEALMKMMLGLGHERDTAVALLDALGDSANLRARFRDGVRSRLARIFADAGLADSPADARNAAIIVLNLLKVLPKLPSESGRLHALLVEMQTVIALYLQHLHDDARAAPR